MTMMNALFVVMMKRMKRKAMKKITLLMIKHQQTQKKTCPHFQLHKVLIAAGSYK